MQIHKVAVPFGNVALGTKVWLTEEQAGARSHLLVADGDKVVDGRRRYIVDGQLGFKAGEELAVDGEFDRGVEMLFGIEGKPEARSRKKATTKVETAQTKAARSKSGEAAAKRAADAKAKRLAAAEKALKEAEADAAEAQCSVDAADDGKKAAAQKRLDTAKAAVEAAGKKLAKAKAS